MSKGVAGALQRLMHVLLPKEEDFFDLFRTMSDLAHQAAVLLHQSYAEPGAGDRREAITELEHRVDGLRHDCVQRLNETFVTPIMFDRQDLLDLSQTLDDVVDYIRAAADRTALYQVKAVPPAVIELTAVLVEIAAATAELCAGLAKMRTSDHELLRRVNELENHADTTLKQGLAELFQHEADVIEVIKWKEIYDYIEEAIDHCEDTASVIEAALVKNS